MLLVEIFLPTFDNQGQQFSRDEFEKVRRELTDRFGGVTAFTRSPASGLWADDSGKIHHDNLAIFEVMTDSLDRQWWQAYRQALEAQFRQEEILIRATEIQKI